MSLQKVISTYEYRNVVTFGGCREDFMLVVTIKPEGATAPETHTRTDRVIFCMTKPKVNCAIIYYHYCLLV